MIGSHLSAVLGQLSASCPPVTASPVLAALRQLAPAVPSDAVVRFGRELASAYSYATAPLEVRHLLAPDAVRAAVTRIMTEAMEKSR